MMNRISEMGILKVTICCSLKLNNLEERARIYRYKITAGHDES